MSSEPSPDFTNPIAGHIEIREPCPWCGDRQMIPRNQLNEHVMRLHPDVRTGEVSAPKEAVQPVTLPHYTATLTVQRDDAEGEVIVRGVVTGTAAAVVQATHALADAFETEAQR